MCLFPTVVAVNCVAAVKRERKEGGATKGGPTAPSHLHTTSNAHAQHGNCYAFSLRCTALLYIAVWLCIRRKSDSEWCSATYAG